MAYILILLGFFVAACLLTLVVGILMQFSEKNKKFGLQMILYSIIGIVIGFGTCFASVAINNRL